MIDVVCVVAKEVMNWSEELEAQVNEIWKRSLVRILVKLVAEMVDVEGR